MAIYRNRVFLGGTILIRTVHFTVTQTQPFVPMNTIVELAPVAAVGYSILYMIFGGGLFGAVVIFVIAKMFGK